MLIAELSRKPDVEVMNAGSIFLFTPHSLEAKDWIEEHTADALWFGDSIAIEHRYARDLASAMIEDGLCVR